MMKGLSMAISLTLLICFILTGCTTQTRYVSAGSHPPEVDKLWLGAHCQNYPKLVEEHGGYCYEFCNKDPEIGCVCEYSNGDAFIGNLDGAVRDGLGIYKWSSGETFVGTWKAGQPWCGVGKTEQVYVVLKDGREVKRDIVYQQRLENVPVVDVALLGDILIATIAVAAIAYGVEGINSGAGYSSGYDWDGFHDLWGNLQWRCRSLSTGEFTEDYNCSGQLKNDNRWPQK